MTFIKEYPQDFFVKFDNDDYREGRITVNKLQSGFSAEISIVQKDSRKIWQHVDIIYGYNEEGEAVDTAVQKLSSYLAKLD